MDVLELLIEKTEKAGKEFMFILLLPVFGYLI